MRCHATREAAEDLFLAFDARARELRDGDELEDPLLDVLEPVVVRVEHLRT